MFGRIHAGTRDFLSIYFSPALGRVMLVLIKYPPSVRVPMRKSFNTHDCGFGWNATNELRHEMPQPIVRFRGSECQCRIRGLVVNGLLGGHKYMY